MNKVIHGEDATYYSQRNNVEDPARACGVTSAINALVALGWKLPSSGVGQPEDRLMRFIRGDRICRDRHAALDPRGQYPINEWQEVLALGISRWMQIPELAQFYEETPSQAILDHIVTGGACLLTGVFPSQNGKTITHTVACIGAQFDGDPRVENLRKWFIRDPWGDHRSLYKNVIGRLVDVDPNEFEMIMKTEGHDSKWCVFIEGKKED